MKMVCSYCGLEAECHEPNGPIKLWRHKEFGGFQRGSHIWVHVVSAMKYNMNIVVITEEEYRVKQVIKELDGTDTWYNY